MLTLSLFISPDEQSFYHLMSHDYEMLLSFIFYQVVFCLCNVGSEKNASSQTLDGVDVMGERLSEEVRLFFFHILLQ